MKKQDNSISALNRAFKKVLAVVLCSCMLFGVVGLTGCKFWDDLSNGLNSSQKAMPETELARLMANAILDDNEVSKSYAKIPNNQLGGLSYSVLSEYCAILRKSSNAHGYADSFRILTDSEKEQYFKTIDPVEDNSGYRKIDIYGDMVTFAI